MAMVVAESVTTPSAATDATLMYSESPAIPVTVESLMSARSSKNGAQVSGLMSVLASMVIAGVEVDSHVLKVRSLNRTRPSVST